MSEAGTPSELASTVYDAKADAYKVDAEGKLATVSGASDKSFFAGWNVFFTAPAVVRCQPVVLPTVRGMATGSLDPCPVVDGVRYVMGYIWALTCMWACLGMVKKVV